MLVAYEGGLLWLGPQGMRNGVDVWLRQLLQWIGFGQYFLLPMLTCGLLLAWHHLNRERWRFGWSVLYGMFVECVILAVALLAAARLQGALLASLSIREIVSVADLEGTGHVVAFFGAGLYEELLFRLMLLPAVVMLLRAGGMERSGSLWVAVLLTSLLFAAAHYRLEFAAGPIHWAMPYGEPFAWVSFGFRFLAGAFFSVVFLQRGFGIAAGTHALYDILVYSL
jgi:membrane protease YdiL (CAAX protease family)